MKAYVDWVVQQALPTWASSGFDAARGRFQERLDLAGKPIVLPHRAMVQARQIYVFAHAAQLGCFAEGRRLAETAMASMLGDFCVETPDQASFAFSIDPRGGIVSDVRDAYTHAFVLFALAWVYRLNGDERMLTIADKTIAFIEDRLTDPVHGGLFDAVPAPSRDKRQNPLMHLLEAYLFLDQAASGRGYLERAAGLVALFKHRLYRAEPGVLLEHFGYDWLPHGDPAKADVFEPGHHFEWVWLLATYGGQVGETVEPWASRLHETACRYGIDGDGLIFDEVGADLTPRKRSHRIWPHTEAIKAAVARDAAGDAHALDLADGMSSVLMARFLGRPFAGGWVDHLSEAGEPLVDYVPASTLYHIFLAAAEARRCLEDRHGANPQDSRP
jgi:mannose/cellobiose epimerase-like protein (N-acyl-D-glucosamine 2-epimerase family)